MSLEAEFLVGGPFISQTHTTVCTIQVYLTRNTLVEISKHHTI